MAEFDWPDEIVEALGNASSPLVACTGKLVADEVHLMEGRLVSGGHVPAERTLRAGGAPANITALLAANGIAARLTGWVGADPTAQGLVSELRGQGVQFRCKVEGRSPKATVLVDDKGERALLTDGGEGTLTPDDVRREWYDGAAVVHLDGYDLLEERFPQAVQRASEVAHELGCLVSVDMAAANRIAAMGVDVYMEMIRNLRPHVMFANADEAEVLRLNAQRLAWLPLLVTHRGPKSTYVSTREVKSEYPVPPKKVIDSTGCGDAMAAGFLSGLVLGLGVDETVERAHEWAQRIGEVLGAQLPGDSTTWVVG